MEFDFKDLEILKQIIEQQSFTKASSKVYLAQASVSERVSNLEAQIGLRLFDRLPKGVFPTKAGKIFYEYAKRMLKLKGELIAELQDLVGLKGGSLELGGSTVPGEYILPGLISEFISMYPQVVINLSIGDSKEIRERILTGELDLGVVGAMDRSLHLEFVPLWWDQLVIAVYKGHRFYGKESVGLEEIKAEPFVVREEGSGTLSFVAQCLLSHDLSIERDLRVVGRLGSTTAIKEAVKAGLGISIISKRAIEAEIQRGELWPVNITPMDMRRYFYLTFDKRRSLSPVVREFKEYLLNLRDTNLKSSQIEAN